MSNPITDAISKADRLVAMEAAAEHLAQECGEKTVRIRELEGELARERIAGAAYETEAETEIAKLRAQLAAWLPLCAWGGTPEAVESFIKGQQDRIHAAQGVEAELASIRGALLVSGRLARAGIIDRDGEELSGLMIELPRDTLRAIPRLPMYERVSVYVEGKS